MPYFSDTPFEPADDLDITVRVMHTVEQQISSYRSSLEKIRELRIECEHDPDLKERVFSSPDAMLEMLAEREIPPQIATGMVAEDFQDHDFGGEQAIFTFACCCTGCCVTCIVTNIG